MTAKLLLLVWAFWGWWDASSEAASLQREAPALGRSAADSLATEMDSAHVPDASAVPPGDSSGLENPVRVVLVDNVVGAKIVLEGGFLARGVAVSQTTLSPRKPDPADLLLPLELDGAVLLVPATDSSFFRLGSRSYRGRLRLLRHEGRLCAVNEVGLEDYLTGVVPGEIGRKLDAGLLEAVKAQAIVARTYATRALGQYGGKPWDLRDDVRDQVYEGRGGEDPLCTRAVTETRARILVDAAGRPIDSYYHSTSGGATADISEVWPGKPARSYLRGVMDTAPDGRAWGAYAPSAAWSESWPEKTLHTAARKDLPSALAKPCDPGEVVSLSVAGYDGSGRARKLVVAGRKATCEVAGDRIRWALRRPGGKGILRSSRFSLERVDGRYVAKGTGNGHGVGLSQTGAIARARAGQRCEAILTTYYPGTSLDRARVLPESPKP